jgi:hypothetical protein
VSGLPEDTSRPVRSTGKSAKLFYDLILAAAGCLASEVLFVGDNWSCVLLVATAEKDAAEDGS